MKSIRSKNLSRVLILALAAFLIAALSGCGKSGSNGGNQASEQASKAPATAAPADQSGAAKEKTTLTFWNGFTGPDGDFLKQIVNDYNEHNTANVEIKMDIIPWDQLGQKLPASIATNSAPSFVALIAGTSTSYIKNGSIQDLSDYFDVSGANEADLVKASLQLGNQNGKQYLLPMQVNGLYLYWNKDLFTHAGLDASKPPATLDELAQDAAKLTDASQDQFGYGLPISGTVPYFVSFIRGNGGAVVDMQNKTSALNSPQNIQTFQWMQDLVDKQKISPKNAAGADLEKLMQSGKLAMYIDGPWLAPGLKSSGINFGVGLPPKGSVTQSTVFDGIGFAIPNTTKPELKKAVYDFIKYWESPEVVKKWSLKNGFPPYVNSLLNDPDILADPVVSGMSNMGDAAQTFLTGLSSADKITNDILLGAIGAVENGQDPADVIGKASKDIDSALQEMDK